MEPRIQSSFIPKNPVSFESKPKHRRGSPSLVFMLSVVIFVGACLGWGGLFFYKGLLETQLAEKSTALESARASFAPAFIQEIERLDTRLITATTLLKEHTAPSALFQLLSNITLRTVQFNNLDYVVLPDGRITLSLKGSAYNFASLALQADAFSAERSFIDPLIVNPNLDKVGNVIFELTTQVVPSALSYSTVAEALLPEEDSATSTNDGGSVSPQSEGAPEDTTDTSVTP